MHLTNYALNKESGKYHAGDYEDETGHKRSFGAILKQLSNDGANTELFLEQLKDLIIKTIIVG